MPNYSTPLHNAAINGNNEEFNWIKNNQLHNFLIWLGKTDNNNDLPLDRAAARGHFLIVKGLVDAHKKNNLPYTIHNLNGYSPLLAAVRWFLKVLDASYKNGRVIGIFNTGPDFIENYFSIIKLLIEEFPEYVNKPDDKGCNALYYAIHHWYDAIRDKEEYAETIQSLVELLLNAKIYLYTGNEKSPMSLAVRYGLGTRLKYLSERCEAKTSKNLATEAKPEIKSDPEMKAEPEEKVIKKSPSAPKPKKLTSAYQLECEEEEVYTKPAGNSLFKKPLKSKPSKVLKSEELIELFFTTSEFHSKKIDQATARKDLDKFFKENKVRFSTFSVKNLNKFLQEDVQMCFEIKYPLLGSLCYKKPQLHFNNDLARLLIDELPFDKPFSP